MAVGSQGTSYHSYLFYPSSSPTNTCWRDETNYARLTRFPTTRLAHSVKQANSTGDPLYVEVECKRTRHGVEVYQDWWRKRINMHYIVFCTFRFLRPENKGFVWVDEWQEIGIPGDMDMLRFSFHQTTIGGGFKMLQTFFLFTPKIGEMIPFDEHQHFFKWVGSTTNSTAMPFRNVLVPPWAPWGNSGCDSVQGLPVPSV